VVFETAKSQKAMGGVGCTHGQYNQLAERGTLVSTQETFSPLWGASLESTVMMALQAYFDESGKLQDKNADHVVFGGIAGKMDEVSVFSRKWQAILGSDVDHIHMKDAMHFNGAFRGWGNRESRRDEILIECAKVAFENSAMLIVSEMEKKAFHSLAETQRKRLKNPVYGGFEGCVRALAQSFPGHDFNLWYDESQEYAETCLKMYQRMKSMHVNFAHRLPSITFANDEKCPGLQAADMVAYSAFVVGRDGSSAPRIVKAINSTLRKEINGKGHLLYTKGETLGSGILES